MTANIVRIIGASIFIHKSGHVSVDANFNEQEDKTIRRLGRGKYVGTYGNSSVFDYKFGGKDISLWFRE